MFVVWRGSVGCPVCQVDDFEEVVGSCDGGQQRIVYIQKSNCVGRPSSLQDRVEKCSSNTFSL